MDHEEELPNRRGTASVKWDLGGAAELPLWVADMDFPLAPEALAAMRKRLDHPVLGYGMVPGTWKEALRSWVIRHQGWLPTDPLPLQGLMSGISLAVLALSKPGQGVVVEPPVYHPFLSLPPALDRVLLEAPLVTRVHGARGKELGTVHLERDLDALERLFREQRPRLMLISSPHNPGGRVWTSHELVALGALCRAWDVTLVADEIHIDLHRRHEGAVAPKSLGSLLQEGAWGSEPPGVVILQAPTKTFNAAGISSAWAQTSTPDLRQALARSQSALGLEVINVLAFDAATALYGQGEAWWDRVTRRIDANLTWWQGRLEALEMSRGLGIAGGVPEAGYLYWFRYGEVPEPDSQTLVKELRSRGLRLNPGSQFGTGGEGFLRVNLATGTGIMSRAWDILAPVLAGEPRER